MDARTRADIDQKYARVADAIRTNGWLVQLRIVPEEVPNPGDIVFVARTTSAQTRPRSQSCS